MCCWADASSSCNVGHLYQPLDSTHFDVAWLFAVQHVELIMNLLDFTLCVIALLGELAGHVAFAAVARDSIARLHCSPNPIFLNPVLMLKIALPATVNARRNLPPCQGA